MKIQHVCEISGLGTHVVLAKVCNIENKYKKTLESWQSLFFSTELLFIILISAKSFNVGFHLHLLVFPLVYQFNSRIVALVICKWLVQKDFNIISASLQKLFVVGFTRKECSFYTNLFCCTEMR